MKISFTAKIALIVSIITTGFVGLLAAAEALAVGAAAPAAKGVDQDNKTVDLAALYKTGYVLVYFYPKAGTKGCTDEACSLRDAFNDLSKEKLTIVGVSMDSVADQKKFATDQKLPFSLVADEKGEIYKAFAVPGRGNRESFLVKDGVIVWHDPKASTAQQAADVKKALDAAKAAPAKSAPANSSTPAPATPTPPAAK